MGKVLLSADSTCDLGAELKEEYQVHYYPFHIILDGRDYQDNVDITPQDIFKTYYDKKLLPQTAAINVQEYLDYFRSFVEHEESYKGHYCNDSYQCEECQQHVTVL